MRRNAKEGEGQLRGQEAPPQACRRVRALPTCCCVCSLQKLSEPIGAPKQLKVPGRPVYHAVREECGIHNGAGTSRRDDFTFGGVELKPDTCSGRSQGVEGFRHS